MANIGIWSNVWTNIVPVGNGMSQAVEMVSRAEAEAYLAGVGDWALASALGRGKEFKAEVERLRAIEAAARALGPDRTWAIPHEIYKCPFCGGFYNYVKFLHKPDCPWIALRIALGQGEEG